MSSPSDDAQIVAFFGTLRTGSYVSTVPISLLIYDYVVTFDLEAELFWTRKFTGASLLFVSNRYIAIVLELFAMAELSFTLTDGSCNGLSKTASIMQDVRFLPWAAFAAMRGFALTKSRATAAVIFTLSIAPLVVNLAQFAIGMTGIAEPIVGCVSSRNSTPQEDLIFPIVSRGGLIIADFILVVATWRTLGAASIRPSMTKMSQGVTRGDHVVEWAAILCVSMMLVRRSLPQPERALHAQRSPPDLHAHLHFRSQPQLHHGVHRTADYHPHHAVPSRPTGGQPARREARLRLPAALLRGVGRHAELRARYELHLRGHRLGRSSGG
ncbi:hypothetical protein OH76DRAFT_1408156 [Lentinus brumalis]|uniref:DUF6533 domain-containing protein n=1 Tax=Lentinus brumalis TaxID=2498619 RepID=A0A371CYM6_9APHY|nr:hypothetical protein OH76DRAFT_1408156 [Polyporus brumalis]